MATKSKFKSTMKVLDNRAIQGVCSCGWKGNALAQTSGVAAAMAAAQSEIQAHTHIPAPPKVRKNSKKATANKEKV